MTSELRILFVNRMASMERGGGETFDLEISRHLAALGCQITVLSGWPIFKKMPIATCHLSILDHAPPMAHRHLRSPYLPWFPWDKVKGGWRIRVWEFKQFEKKAARWIKAHQDEFDIIQICELPYLVSLLKSPVSGLRSRIVMRLTAPNCYDMWGGIQKADALIASGTSIAKIRAKVRSDCHDIPNAVDTNRFQVSGSTFQGAGIRPRYRIPGDAFVGLYVARFQAFKNHSVLLDAWAQLPSTCHLVLAGSGPLQKSIEAKAGALGIHDRVHFLGEVAYADLPDIYAAADLKVISSDYESFCFAALEGMAAGRPLVATDCGWVPGLMGDTTPPIQKQWADEQPEPADRFAEDVPGRRIRSVPGGLVVGRNDAASLGAAVRLMLDDPGLRSACGTWNREKAVREHGWESSARKLLGVYEELLHH